jgi:WD40 repeat protein
MLVCWVASAPAQPPTPKPRVDALGDALPDGAIARLGSTRFRHGGKTLLGFTQDGKRLLFHSPGAIHLMDVDTGKISKVLRFKDEATLSSMNPIRGFQVQDAALSGDARVLAYLDEGEQSFGIVDAVAGKELQRIRANVLLDAQGQLAQMRFQLSGNGKVLLLYPGRFGFSTTLAWADTTTGQKLHAVNAPQGSQWRHAQLSHDGKMVAAMPQGGPDSSKLYLYDTATGKEIRALSVDRPNDFTFILRDDGKTLIGWAGTNGNTPALVGPPGSDKKADGAVTLYDMTGDKQLKEIRKFGNTSFAGAVLLSADNKELFIRDGNTITQWNIDSGKKAQVFEVGRSDELDRFGNQALRPPVLSPDNKRLAVANAKTVAVYNVATGASLTPATSGGAVALVRYAPDGQTLFTSTLTQNNWIWDAHQAKPLHKLALPPNISGPSRDGVFTSLFSALALSSDGKYAAQCLGGPGVEVWDTASGKHLRTLGGDAKATSGDAPPTAIAFAPDSYLLATAGEDGLVRIWDASTGRLLRQWRWHKADSKQNNRTDSGMLSLAFSPDGKTLVGVGFESLGGADSGATFLTFWEAATGRERLRQRTTFDLVRENFAAIVQILDQFAMTLKFSPDGKTLAMGTFNNLHVIDTTTGKDIHAYSSRLCLGKTATFSADGKLLFLGRYDGGIRVLEAATGNIIRDVPAHEEGVLTLALSPDGKTLATGSADATVLLWDVAEISKARPAGKTALGAEQLAALWNDLADPNGKKAYDAINLLAAAPASVVPFVKDKLKPIPPVDPQVLDKLFTDLNSEKFKDRDKASAELEKLGDLALGALQKRLAANPSLEMRQRMDKILAKLQGPVKSPDMLRMFGAIEALEKMGTPEALTVLEALASGAPGHRVTEDARLAVQRLKAR